MLSISLHTSISEIFFLPFPRSLIPFDISLAISNGRGFHSELRPCGSLEILMKAFSFRESIKQPMYSFSMSMLNTMLFFRLSRALIYIFLNDFMLDPPWTPHENTWYLHGGVWGGVPAPEFYYLSFVRAKSLIKNAIIIPRNNHIIFFFLFFC